MPDMPQEISGNAVLDRRTGHAGGQLLDGRPADLHPSPGDAGSPAAGRPRAIDLSVIGAAVGGWGIILLAFWVVFAGDPGMVEPLLVVSAVSVLILSMIFGLGYLAGQSRFPSDRPVPVSFSDFMRGEIQTCTGRLPGRQIFLLVAGISAGLAVGGIGFAIIVAAVS